MDRQILHVEYTDKPIIHAFRRADIRGMSLCQNEGKSLLFLEALVVIFPFGSLAPMVGLHKTTENRTSASVQVLLNIEKDNQAATTNIPATRGQIRVPKQSR